MHYPHSALTENAPKRDNRRHTNKAKTTKSAERTATTKNNRASNTKSCNRRSNEQSKKTDTCISLSSSGKTKKTNTKKHLWKAIKAMKSKFTPRYIQMKNRKGTLVPLKKRAEAIADYLENSHWSNPTADGAKRDICRDKIRQDVTKEEQEHSQARQRADFTMEELNEAILLGKKGKAPGPDGIIVELIKWLAHQNRELLLKTINNWWQAEEAPRELYFAKVATIYKKGETNRAENYRPISLLSGFYKIYMMLIRKRIQSEVEDLVSKA